MKRTHRDALLLVLAVLALRIPFLTQAIGGDDPYYIRAAEHAQIDPWHPNHVSFVFQGRDVSFRGYPHPPGNAWIQAALLAVIGDVMEVPFHAAYILFSCIAVLSVYSLARKFSPAPLAAALLFLAVPVFVINGNTLESDLPFVAFWLAGFALYVAEFRVLAALALCGAALISYQSVLALPILLLHDRKGLRSWLPAASPVCVMILWQSFEKVTSGQFPAEVTAGYLSSYGYQRLEMKLRNAHALAVHFWFLIFPLLVPPALWVGFKRRHWFLLGWVVVFTAAAMVLFYSGAARYLLPVAAPLAILASCLPRRWYTLAFALQLCLSVALATVNFQHWNAYRTLAGEVPAGSDRIWANAEWGFRFYLEERGALPVHEGQWIPTGDLIATSDLAFPVEINHGGRSLVPVLSKDIRSAMPLRLIGLHSAAAYATNAGGGLPFAISQSAIDRVHAEVLVAREPQSSWLDMNSAEFDDQAVSGTYRLEENRFRWTSGSAVFLLKAPRNPSMVAAHVYVPELAKARHLELLLDGKTVATFDCPGPGTYSVEASLAKSALESSKSAVLTLQVDRTFTAPGDNRQLGVILTGIGFRE